MGKKRKASRPSGSSGPKDFDPADAKLGPVTTYEDLADSEEEYFINKDKILLEDEPRSKRLKRQQEEDDFLEPSDEEILDFDDESEEEDDSDGEPKLQKGKAVKKVVEDSDDEQQVDEEGDASWWGDSKQEYYNADNIETEADALEEEAEARRLQQKKLSKMSEADFIFDEDEWMAPDAEAEGGDVVTEVLKDLEVTADMSPEERLRILQARYPEFEYLVDEFQTLQPELAICQKEAEGKPSKSLEVVKYWVLGSYIAALASYFAILTSPARDVNGTQKPLDPAELRDHEIMETLVGCREAWQKVKNLKPSRASLAALPSPPEDESDAFEQPEVIKKASKKSKDTAVNSDEKKKKKAEKEKRAKAKEIEDSLADLSALLDTSKRTKKVKFAASTPAQADDDRSDFGEEDIIDARTAADKAAKKKSLRFYTSQIVQKANRRSDAGRDAGGDADIPYRERFRDRQARLNAEAERRGQKDSKHGAALGEDSDGEDDGVANRMRDDEDEYYDMVAARSQRKKEDKAARHEALAAASKTDRVVEREEIGEDGKRKITYAIQKNKGLTPHRKKDNRNPRVKKRKAYKAKQQKLGSMRAVYKGGEGKGGYQGELTGIKSGLVKSVKL